MIQFIRSEEQIDDHFQLLAKRAKAFWNWDQNPIMQIEIRPAKSKRTVDQNALFWVWMEQLSAYFTQNGRRLSKEDAHDLMCHNFLGYEDKTVGQTQIRKMRTTSKLRVGEFQQFLDEIDAWAADKGCLLVMPAEADYERRKKRSKA